MVLLRYNGIEKTISGAELQTTNNRMELLAVINGLEILKEPCIVKITTDSQDVMHGMKQWIDNWIKKGWLNTSSTKIKNVDLWQRLYSLSKQQQLSWQWVKGHTGHPDNEKVDQLARQARDQLLRDKT